MGFTVLTLLYINDTDSVVNVGGASRHWRNMSLEKHVAGETRRWRNTSLEKRVGGKQKFVENYVAILHGVILKIKEAETTIFYHFLSVISVLTGESIRDKQCRKNDHWKCTYEPLRVRRARGGRMINAAKNDHWKCTYEPLRLRKGLEG